MFFAYMKKFIKFAEFSKDNKVLLIVDNHDLLIKLIRELEAVFLTFPPHYSHRLEALDTVFRPIKVYYNATPEYWLKNHPGQTFGIYDISMLCSTGNSVSGFKCTGIYLFNQHIFTDFAFCNNYVTDRPLTQTSETLPLLLLLQPLHHQHRKLHLTILTMLSPSHKWI